MNAASAPLVWPHGPHTLVGATIGADCVVYQCSCGFITPALPTPQHAFFAYQEHWRAAVVFAAFTPPLGGRS